MYNVSAGGVRMNYDLVKLRSQIEQEILIDEVYSFSKEYLEQTEILELNNVKIEGSICLDSLGELILSLAIDGTMVLPCSITLEPVSYPFHIDIDGNVQKILDEMEENPQKVENSLDILPIIWENILMEIPMKVTSPNAKDMELEGEGWRLVTEEDSKETNPALEKLKDLL